MLRAPSWTAGVGAQETDDDDDDNSLCINRATISSSQSNQVDKDDVNGKTSNHTSNGKTRNHIAKDGRTRSDKEPSIKITVPTAFLATKDASSYHVYQIFIQTKEKEWNVYRRYSQFHALHVSLRKDHNHIAKLDFPPKERINNKTSNTVQLRRKRLEAYLAALVDYIDDSDSFTDNNSKKDLIDKFNNFILVGSRFEIDTSSPIPGNPNAQQSTVADNYSLQASLS